MTQVLGERATTGAPTVDDAMVHELFLQGLADNIQLVLPGQTP